MSSIVILNKSETGKSKTISEESVFYKRSILVSQEIKRGDRFTKENIRIARPGDGLCPSKWSEVLGKRALIDMEIGDLLSMEDTM